MFVTNRIREKRFEGLEVVNETDVYDLSPREVFTAEGCLLHRQERVRQRHGGQVGDVYFSHVRSSPTFDDHFLHPLK